jgi:two-component system, OmpR family, sensor kinase
VRGLSLRARLLAGMAVVVAALILVAITVTATTRAYLIDQIDDRLAAAGGPERDDLGPHGPPAGGQGERLGDLYEGEIGSDGQLRTIFPSNPSGEELPAPDIDPERAASAASTGASFTTGAVGGGDLRYRVRVRAGDDELHITALPLTDVDETISRLITVEVVATLIIVAVLGAVTWWVIRLGIRPIKRMTRTATAIAAGERDLSQRVPATAPSTEAGQLGVALNDMLQTLETAFAERTESQERLRRFVADASHELRTPVTTIRGYAELYRMGGLAGPGELDEAMRRTEQEAVRMARLVDDLLALAKFDAGRPLDRHPIDLTALIADAARDARAVDPDRPITTELDGPVVVLGDEDRLRQVLANVVGNALVHTPHGAPIELAATTAHGDARVTVTDHGRGMTPEVAARVTERFYRADRARARDRGGSGLGLAIADAAVIAHGGTITVESALGAGTTVTIRLPLAT